MLAFTATAKVPGTPANCAKILKKVGLKDYEMGKTKVSLRCGQVGSWVLFAFVSCCVLHV